MAPANLNKSLYLGAIFECQGKGKIFAQNHLKCKSFMNYHKFFLWAYKNNYLDLLTPGNIVLVHLPISLYEIIPRKGENHAPI